MKKSRGFTIVEISLVLAIAGLIIVMAFVALPSLWSSQRDADRRANVMNLITALKTYQTNNSRGALPTGGNQTYTLENPVTSSGTADGWAEFIQQFYTKGSRMEDPSGNVYQIRVISECGVTTVGATCTTGLATDPFEAVNGNSYTFNIDNPIIYVVRGATCDENENAIVKTANNRSVAAVQVLEHGKYCHNT